MKIIFSLFAVSSHFDIMQIVLCVYTKSLAQILTNLRSLMFKSDFNRFSQSILLLVVGTFLQLSADDGDIKISVDPT